MNRIFKFRCWDADNQRMIPFHQMIDDHWGIADVNTEDVMQYTGFNNKDGGEVYEGDIFRIEEDTDEGTEFIYVVVVWVQEWAMFTTLRIEDEYQAYLLEGVDAIDETMFWTYTLEDISSPKHFPCGNLYENPELLQP